MLRILFFKFIKEERLIYLFRLSKIGNQMDFLENKKYIMEVLINYNLIKI